LIRYWRGNHEFIEFHELKLLTEINGINVAVRFIARINTVA